ncbi:ERF family protein, partial [Enterococcus faecalis]
MAEQLNVYQRLAEVRKKVSYLKKEQSGSQFNYVGSSDVLGALHSKINEMGLLLQPAITGHKVKDQIEIINQYNKYTKQTEQKQRITYFTELEMTMRWINIDDPEDFLESKWYAQGVDIAG